MLGINVNRQHFEISRKQALTFHANCFLRRQFACDVKACFWRKNKKIQSAEFAQRVVKIKVGIYTKSYHITAYNLTCFISLVPTPFYLRSIMTQQKRGNPGNTQPFQYTKRQPASMAQLETRSTGDQEVAVSTGRPHGN